MLPPRAVVLLLLFPSAVFAQAPDRPEDAPRAFQQVVTGVRTPRPAIESPTSVTVIPRRELQRTPNQTIDAVLRTVPSVTTFQNSTSLFADPTTEGITLRGLGPSEVSRALVLLDGLPLNDPFGGWVYWRSLPKLSLQRVEVAPGGSSAQYGSSALGGVIQMFSRPIEDRSLEAEGSFGSFLTSEGSVRGAARVGAIAFSLEGDALRSRGFVPVVESQRGPIDQRAESRSLTGDARLEAQVHRRVTLHFRLRGFDESENGGTALTTTHVWTDQLAFGARVKGGEFGDFDVDVFGGDQRFLQQRAQIAPGRQTETLFATQNTPSSDVGAAAIWSSPVFWAGGRHVVTAGTDLHGISGETREFSETGTLTERRSGGSESFFGVFVQDLYRPTNHVDILGALRFDQWWNYDGTLNTIEHRTLNSGGTPSTIDLERQTSFADRTERELSPRLAARVQLIDAVSLRASVYRGFRAPTLNELYRPVQLGSVLTAANPNLSSEHVLGAEAGVELLPLKTLHARVMGFWNSLDEPIVSTSSPDGTARQRQNLGAARILGADFEAEWRPRKPLYVIAGYEYASPTVSSNPDAPELVGKELPHDPRHRAILQAGFEDERLFTGTLQLRFVGPQFEDQRNALPMAGYVVVDAFASRDIGYGLSVFGAVENLFDQTYLVSRAGVDTIGQPRSFRAGLRFRY